MPQFQFQDTSIPGLTLIDPFLAPDDRGYLSKSFERAVFAAHGIELFPWEELRSCSRKGVLRGLHLQRRHSQDKLVQVLRGAVYDVAVDLRRDSPAFGRWEGFYLTEGNRKMLYIPKGFAHGFLALEENTLFSYLCGDRYDPESDGGVRWDDPRLGVEWPLDRVERVILSDKDAALEAGLLRAVTLVISDTYGPGSRWRMGSVGWGRMGRCPRSGSCLWNTLGKWCVL